MNRKADSKTNAAGKSCCQKDAGNCQGGGGACCKRKN
jgi:hypothetical protein